MPNNQLVLHSEQKSKKIKKKNKKNKKRTYETIVGCPKYQEKIFKKIEECPDIPATLKRQFKNIEINPNIIIVEDLPSGYNILEYIEFFNTLVQSLIPRYAENNVDPLKNF